MIGPLETVSDYITDVRTLILDKTKPYRYDDDSLLTAFNLSLLDGRRLRPDLFVFRHDAKVPFYTTVSSEEVCIEPQFRKAFVYGTAAHALARDEEDIQDARSVSFMGTFSSILTGTGISMPQGGTPNNAGAKK
jgi:hypothetical protein